MHKVFSWLKRPYFVNTNLITNLWIDLMLGASVFLFLIVFERAGGRTDGQVGWLAGSVYV